MRLKLWPGKVAKVARIQRNKSSIKENIDGSVQVLELSYAILFVSVLNLVTGKSFSEALILASTNPQYDKRLFMELP